MRVTHWNVFYWVIFPKKIILLQQRFLHWNRFHRSIRLNLLQGLKQAPCIFFKKVFVYLRFPRLCFFRLLFALVIMRNTIKAIGSTKIMIVIAVIPLKRLLPLAQLHISGTSSFFFEVIVDYYPTSNHAVPEKLQTRLFALSNQHCRVSVCCQTISILYRWWWYSQLFALQWVDLHLSVFVPGFYW